MNNIVSIQFNDYEGVLYKNLADCIENMITSGEINEGDKLPPVRKLAVDLKMNNATVVAAYKLLEEQGLIYTKPGSGAYCLPKETVLAADFENAGKIEEYGKIAIHPGMINLGGNTPESSIFPVKDFQLAINRVLDNDGGEAFSYQESEGYYGFRETLSHFCFNQYHIKCKPADILITSGAQQAIDVVAKALIQAGDTVMVENPSYIGARSVFSMRGAKILGVPIQDDGINLNVLESYIKRYKPQVLYTMPVYQTPTSICMSPQKRTTLIELAHKYHFYIIEDDLLSDLSLSDQAIYPIKSQDHYDRVIYIKSFSKLLMPGIRTGFIIVPKKLTNSIVNAKYNTDISSSGLIQRALSEYLKNGSWNKHIAYVSDIYKNRMYTAVEVLSELKEFDVKFTNPTGGFGLWLTLPNKLTDKAIYNKCLYQNVITALGSMFYISMMAGSDSHLRISYACENENLIREGLTTVNRCIKELLTVDRNKYIYI